MSRIRYVGGTITKTTVGDHKIYSEGNIVQNAGGTITETGDENGVSFGKPKKPPVIDKISSNCLVEFRTKQDGTYTGQFGFDWLRVDDNALTTEPKYYDCIENGYEAPNGKAPNRDSNTEHETKDEAYKALKKGYSKIPVKMPVTTPATPAKDYFVPYLNLFSKPFSDAITVPAGMPKPPFEAELRTLIEVGGTDEPDQVRVVFDKRYFEINGKDGSDATPVLISNKIVGAKRDATADILKIKCIAEFDNTQQIKVFSYPKGTVVLPLAEQLAKRELAGKILVLPNKNTAGKAPVKNVKKLKVVLVKVKTNIAGVINTGTFDIGSAAGEKKDLLNGLYQALIQTTIIDSQTSAAGVVTNLELDVSANTQFKQQYNAAGTAIASALVDAFGVISSGNALIPALKTLFHAQTANRYINDFIAFALDEASGRVAGRVEDIKKKAVVLFNVRNSKTLPHEGMHGLGLYHTHRDLNHVHINGTNPNTATIFDDANRPAITHNPSLPRDKTNLYVGTDNSTWNYDNITRTYVLSTNYCRHDHPKTQKFVFKHAWYDSTHATDNFMSYNGALRKSTWQWQWKLIKSNL
ncbi:hypothetical protein [Flavobacterium sp.]|uniref:hypothetical protein n=1 Tax=Flavobacterium sp. TaxID=239 RepID=UPI0037532D7F